jgi:stage II sporulation SpoAA-like protein
VSAYQLRTILEGNDEITVVELSGHADRANIQKLLAELQGLAEQRGPLRILVDETQMRPGLMGFNDIHDLVNDWRTATSLKTSRIAVVAQHPIVRGLNQAFRALANLERKGFMSAFSQRADAIAWLVRR